MPSGINALIEHLTKRLPELEWQLQKLGSIFPSRKLPPQLFRAASSADASVYINEIKFDLNRLLEPNSPAVQDFLATLVNQKINVLVSLCKRTSKPLHTKPGSHQPLLMDRISTRQQRLEELETIIHDLTQQQEGLLAAAKSRMANPAIQLTLQQELGSLQQRLTLAEEAYKELTS